MFTKTPHGERAMRQLETWLDDYAASHQNPVNKAFHWLCVPPIVFSIWCALKAIPVGNAVFNPATAVIAFMVLYYLRLSWRLAVGMAIASVPAYLGVLALERVSPGTGVFLGIAATIFVVAWIGQFIGHHVEGARPSFFKDLQFLMIGPLWLLAHLYRRLGWPISDTARSRA